MNQNYIHSEYLAVYWPRYFPNVVVVEFRLNHTQVCNWIMGKQRKVQFKLFHGFE